MSWQNNNFIRANAFILWDVMQNSIGIGIGNTKVFQC